METFTEIFSFLTGCPIFLQNLPLLTQFYRNFYKIDISHWNVSFTQVKKITKILFWKLGKSPKNWMFASSSARAIIFCNYYFLSVLSTNFTSKRLNWFYHLFEEFCKNGMCHTEKRISFKKVQWMSINHAIHFEYSFGFLFWNIDVYLFVLKFQFS